jgi:hypothetical protein
MQTLSFNDELRNKMSAAASAYAANFSIEDRAKKIIDFMKNTYFPIEKIQNIM